MDFRSFAEELFKKLWKQPKSKGITLQSPCSSPSENGSSLGKTFWDIPQQIFCTATKLPSTCLKKRFEYDTFEKYLCFISNLQQQFSDFETEVFCRVVKTTFYVSRGTFWRIKADELIELKSFQKSKRKSFGLWAKNFP